MKYSCEKSKDEIINIIARRFHEAGEALKDPDRDDMDYGAYREISHLFAELGISGEREPGDGPRDPGLVQYLRDHGFDEEF